MVQVLQWGDTDGVADALRVLRALAALQPHVYVPQLVEGGGVAVAASLVEHDNPQHLQRDALALLGGVLQQERHASQASDRRTGPKGTALNKLTSWQHVLRTSPSFIGVCLAYLQCILSIKRPDTSLLRFP